MTREIKETDRKMWRNVWNNSRKLQGLFLTLSFSRWNLEEKNTGISRPFFREKRENEIRKKKEPYRASQSLIAASFDSSYDTRKDEEVARSQ